MRQCVRCHTCGNRFRREETSDGLTLSLPDEADADADADADVSLEQCLTELLTPQPLSGDDKYHCDVCKAKSDATLTREIAALPPALVLMLSRTRYSPARGQYKDSRHVAFPPTLDLDELLERVRREQAEQARRERPVSTSLRVLADGRVALSLTPTTTAADATDDGAVTTAAPPGASTSKRLFSDRPRTRSTAAAEAAKAAEAAAIEARAAAPCAESEELRPSFSDDDLPEESPSSVLHMATPGVGGGGGGGTSVAGRHYRLRSVVVHSGLSTDVGHYFAHGRQRHGAWRMYNDARVYSSTERQALGAEAYILCYELSPPGADEAEADADDEGALPVGAEVWPREAADAEGTQTEWGYRLLIGGLVGAIAALVARKLGVLEEVGSGTGA